MTSSSETLGEVFLFVPVAKSYEFLYELHN